MKGRSCYPLYVAFHFLEINSSTSNRGSLCSFTLYYLMPQPHPH